MLPRERGWSLPTSMIGVFAVAIFNTVSPAGMMDGC